MLSEGTDSAGGFSVPDVLAGSFIDRVRAAMVVNRAGAVTVPMTSDNLSLARVATGATVAWKSENSAITPSDIVLERVTFAARTLPILVKLSVELSEDSNNVDQILEREMSNALALELDRVALLGTGIAPEPRGVINQSGVVFQAFNDTGSPADGIPGDYDFLIDAIGSCWGQNFTPNARIYNSQIATILAKLKDTTGQPLQVPAAVAAVPEFRTNQIPNTLGDLGSPAEDDATVAFVGDFRELMVGLRTSFRMEVSRQAAEASSSAFSNLQVWIRAYLRADIQLAHPKAFTVVEGIHTS